MNNGAKRSRIFWRTLNSAEDVDIIMTGLVAFNAICNSYPQVEIDDVIAAVASHVWVALNVRKLVEQGQLEEYKGPDGKTNYRTVPDSDQIRIVKWHDGKPSTTFIGYIISKIRRLFGGPAQKMGRQT